MSKGGVLGKLEHLLFGIVVYNSYNLIDFRHTYMHGLISV